MTFLSQNSKAGVLFSWGINFFPGKINLRKVSEPFSLPRYTEHFGAKTHIFFILTLFTYRTHHTSEYISKRASQHTARALFSSDIDRPEKIHGCRIINKSNERRPRVLY